MISLKNFPDSCSCSISCALLSRIMHWHESRKLLQLLCLLRYYYPQFLHKEGFLALGALHFTLVRHHKQPPAFRARHSNRALPTSKIAAWIIRTGVEDTSLASLAQDDISAIFRARYANFFQQSLGMAARRKVGTADKFAISAPTDHQVVPAFRARAPDFSGSDLVTGISS